MDGDPTHQELTPQEHQVLDLLAEGADGGTIAAKLGLSRNMVRADVQSIMQKLEVHSRLEAVVHHLRSDQDAGLRANLRRLPPRDREALLRWLLADEEDREDIAFQALKRREGGAALAEYIATLTTQPEQRRRFVRLLRDIESEGG
jgi:DNA-binding CsgD family transcriptional regulator